MEKLIRWIADVSGVTNEIEKETRFNISSQLLKSSTWYNATERTRAANALYVYGLNVRTGYHYHDDYLRDVLDKIGNENVQTNEALHKEIFKNFNAI